MSRDPARSWLVTPELIAVIVARPNRRPDRAAPAGRAGGDQGINVPPAILVFATAVTIYPAALRRLVSAWRSLLVALIVGITVLPALSWAVSRYRGGWIAARRGAGGGRGALCDIALVATTAMALAGEAAVSAGVLTVFDRRRGRPGRADPEPGGRARSCVVGRHHRQPRPGGRAAQVVVGLAARACAEVPPPEGRPTRSSSWPVPLLASPPPSPGHAAGSRCRVMDRPRRRRRPRRARSRPSIRVSTAYRESAAALLLLPGGLAGGRASAPVPRRPRRPPDRHRPRHDLDARLRDRGLGGAAAAGLAAAAPLGLYGVAVLVSGTAVAGVLRQRAAQPPPKTSNSTPI